MKKKIFLTILLSFMFIMPSVSALNIASCDSAIGSSTIIDSKIPEMVHSIVTIIKVAVPILLVILGMIDLVKGVVAQKEDDMKKGRSMFIKRLISGVLVFFVFTIVQLIISFVADASKNPGIMDCVSCFINNECTYRTDSNSTCPSGTVLENGVCVIK